MKEVQFVGLTKFGEDVVKGLSLVEDPSHAYLYGVEGKHEPEKHTLKRWTGEIDGVKVNVYENICMTRDVGDKILAFSNLRIRSVSEDYITADWMRNPKMDNSKSKHDKNSGHCKF